MWTILTIQKTTGALNNDEQLREQIVVERSRDWVIRRSSRDRDRACSDLRRAWPWQRPWPGQVIVMLTSGNMRCHNGRLTRSLAIWNPACLLDLLGLRFTYQSIMTWLIKTPALYSRPGWFLMIFASFSTAELV